MLKSTFKQLETVMNESVLEPAGNIPVATMLGVVGAKIRSLRKERGLTLDRLSELSGLSTGIISRVYGGVPNPSSTTLVQLAHGLGIPVGRLFQVQEQYRTPVVRKSERRRLDGHGFGVETDAVYELLTPDLDGALEVTWLETAPGHDTSATPFQHNGEEVGIVLSGRMEVYLAGARYELGPGDSIRYPSTIPHWYVNPGDETCVAIWVITPPTW